MPFRFNQLLIDAGLDPGNVRLLRHASELGGGRSLLETWRTDRAAFEAWQALQLHERRASFARPYWAVFIGLRDGRTMFAGIYSVDAPRRVEEDVIVPLTGLLEPAGRADRFPTQLTDYLADYVGRLFIDWGGGISGKRSWSQRAELQDKRVTELHLVQGEEPFPGFMALTAPLSVIAEAPTVWIERLSEARGVYLLTCPETGELYVGSATAAGGFWSRWLDYRRNGHGGNVALMNRAPVDWRVSILEVAGSADTIDNILAMEALWKAKLQSRTRGLNRN